MAEWTQLIISDADLIYILSVEEGSSPGLRERVKRAAGDGGQDQSAAMSRSRTEMAHSAAWAGVGVSRAA